MARMIRKQIYITEEQECLLKRRALERSASESDLVREGLDYILATQDERKRLEAWAQLEKFFHERSLIKAPQTGRTWTREELYDERPKYLFR